MRMFGWFKRRAERDSNAGAPSDLESLLNLPIDQMVYVYSDTIRDMDLASRGMLLLAYPMIEVLMRVAISEGLKTGDPSLPTTMLGAVRFAIRAKRESRSEIGSRRTAWLALASILVYLSQPHREQHLNDAMAGAWTNLFKAKDALKQAVDDNILFDEHEKAYFRPTSSDRVFSIAMSAIAPKHLRQSGAWDHEYL